MTLAKTVYRYHRQVLDYKDDIYILLMLTQDYSRRPPSSTHRKIRVYSNIVDNSFDY